MFYFTTFKTKGEVVLSAAETGELVEKLEDSQMALGSMSTNRYSEPFKVGRYTSPLGVYVWSICPPYSPISRWLKLDSLI